MKKVVSICLLVSLMTLITVGCAKSQPSAAPGADKGEGAKAGAASEKVTLNVSVWDDKLKDTLNQIIEVYKKDHSNVDVQVTITPVKDYWTKMQTSLVGGSGPDLLMMNGPNFNKFASLGLLSSLQPLIDQEKLDTSVYPQGINDLYKYKKETYGVPFYLGSVGLFYNKELFDQAGIKYPDETWTWETLRANAAKLTNKDKKTYGYVAVNADQVGYYPLIHQAGGSVISADKTKSGLNLPETQQAIQFMKDLMDAGISPTAKQQLETEPLQIFGSGNAAMYPGGSFDAYNLNRMLGGKLGVAVLPKGKQEGFYVHGSSWVINKSSKHQKEAWELLKLITGSTGQELLAKNGINFPAYTKYVDLWAKSIPTLDMKAFVKALEHTQPYPVSQSTAEWSKIATQEITEALLGNKPVKEALDGAAVKMNDILSKEKK